MPAKAKKPKDPKPSEKGLTLTPVSVSAGAAVTKRFLGMVGQAVGTVFSPARLLTTAVDNKVARMQQKNAHALELDKLEFEALRQRTASSITLQHIQEQKNKEDITAKAVNNLNPDAKPEEMDPDWVTNFYNKCKTTANSKKQHYWSRLLSMEANCPGTFSMRAIDLFNELELIEVEAFAALLRIQVQITNEPMRPIYDSRISAGELGLTSGIITRLEFAKVLAPNFVFLDLVKTFTYFGKKYQAFSEPDSKGRLSVPAYGFSFLAEELVPALEPVDPAPWFCDYVRDVILENLPLISTPPSKDFDQRRFLPKPIILIREV